MKKWYFSVCRRRPRSDRYYQVFGREPQYPCALVFLHFLIGGFKCIVCYGLILLLLKWYLWPIVAPTATKYSIVQTTLNRSSSLVDRLRANQNLPFE